MIDQPGDRRFQADSKEQAHPDQQECLGRDEEHLDKPNGHHDAGGRCQPDEKRRVPIEPLAEWPQRFLGGAQCRCGPFRLRDRTLELVVMWLTQQRVMLGRPSRQVG